LPTLALFITHSNWYYWKKKWIPNLKWVHLLFHGVYK
jgi:hypothetical protein